ncbi:hypothetical protein EPI10_021625 [Gossypium australe]|uniref:Uncharacterized protein n=1 Tax=Gossypium australe TaxID=47621 RepID=A0A5B6WJ29_9ROSI|nr:hypothetical protein EPI10_021625 [Gossypium australe]
MIGSKKGIQPSILGFHVSLEDSGRKRKHEKGSLCFFSRKFHVCRVMHTSKYLFHSRVGDSISGKSQSKTLGSS